MVLTRFDSRSRTVNAHAPRLEESVRALPEALRLFLRASMVGRSRVVEDRLRALAASGPTRYVALGTGLDTLAWCHPGLDLEVVEIDQPDSAADKLRRIHAAGLPIPRGWRQLTCDLSSEPLADVLGRAIVDDSRATLISWLGVTQYLPLDAVRESLAAMGTTPAGTEIVFTTFLPDEAAPAEDLESVHRIRSIAKAGGEPVLTQLTRPHVADLIRSSGLTLVGEVGAPDLVKPLFAERTDDLKANAVVLVTLARVP